MDIVVYLSPSFNASYIKVSYTEQVTISVFLEVNHISKIVTDVPQLLLNDYIALIKNRRVVDLYSHDDINDDIVNLFNNTNTIDDIVNDFINNYTNQEFIENSTRILNSLFSTNNTINTSTNTGTTSMITSMIEKVKRHIDRTGVKPPNFKNFSMKGKRKALNFIYSITQESLTPDELKTFMELWE